MSSAESQLDKDLVAAIDGCGPLYGSGILLITKSGVREIRGGPRKQWVYITPASMGSAKATVTNDPAPASKSKLAAFWDEHGNTVLSCTSAAASGAVILLSGGTATPVAGFLAVNSAALCGIGIGKSLEKEAWEEFAKSGGRAYTAWLTIETLMSLADLCGGIKGAAGMLNAWKEAGKLDKLQKILSGKKYTKKAQLLKAINEIDPRFVGKSIGTGHVTKKKLVVTGTELLGKTQKNYKSLSNQQTRVLFDAVGNAMTVYSEAKYGGTTAGGFELVLAFYD